MDPDTIWQAIFGQESNYGRDNRTSVTGARGPAQIQPGTFRQYAKPGERIDNYQDNIAVGKRIVKDLYDKFGGDPERIATAYFSGPGNVSPANSPFPFVKNKTDPTGKSTASYVSDVSRRLSMNEQIPDYLAQSPVQPQAGETVPDYLTQFGKPETVTVPMPKEKPAEARKQGPETPDEMLARVMQEHQAETLSDTATRLGIGGLRGISDVSGTLAQGIAAGGETGANLLQRLGVISPETAQSVADWRTRVARGIETGNAAYEAAARGSTAADIGRIGGQIAGTAPLLAPMTAALPAATPGAGVLANLGRTAIQGAGLGAGATALTSAASNAPLSEQLTQGAKAGALLGPAGHVAGLAGSKAAGILTGAVNPYAAKLAQAAQDRFGINITPMQLADNNSVMRFAQSVLQRVPFTGFGPAVRQQQSQIESALIKEMGETGNRVTPDIIQTAKQNLSSQYNMINKNLGALPVDQATVGRLDDIAKDTDVTRIRNIVDDIKKKIDPATGAIDAKKHQILMETNGKLDKALNSSLGSEKQDAKQIKGVLDDVLRKSDPILADARNEVDYKWAVMRSLEEASAGSPTGGVSPTKVFNAFKEYNQGSNARNATVLGQIAKQFAVEPPSSGTFERLLMGGATAAGAAGLGALGYKEFDPENLQATIARGGAGLAGLLALRYGLSPALRSQTLSNLMVQRALGGGNANKLGNLIGRATVPAAALAYRP